MQMSNFESAQDGTVRSNRSIAASNKNRNPCQGCKKSKLGCVTVKGERRCERCMKRKIDCIPGPGKQQPPGVDIPTPALMQTRHVQVTNPGNDNSNCSSIMSFVSQMLAVQTTQPVTQLTSSVPMPLTESQQYPSLNCLWPVLGNGNCDPSLSHQTSPNDWIPDEDFLYIEQVSMDPHVSQDTVESTQMLVSSNDLTGNGTHELNSSLSGGTNGWSDIETLWLNTDFIDRSSAEN